MIRMESAQLVVLGIVIVFVGFFLIVIGASRNDYNTNTNTKKSETKVAIGGFIGFIPFGWSNDKRLLWAIIGLTALVSIVWFFLQLQIRNS